MAAAVVVTLIVFGLVGRQVLADRAESKFEAVGEQLTTTDDEVAADLAIDDGGGIDRSTPETTRPGYTPYVPPSTTPDTLPTYTYERPAPSTTVPCPRGRPELVVDAADAVEQPRYYAGQTPTWDVTVRGRIINRSSASISVGMIEVRFDGSAAKAYGFSSSHTLRAGESAQWDATGYVFDSATAPRATATMSDWSWADYEHYGCGTV